MSGGYSCPGVFPRRDLLPETPSEQTRTVWTSLSQIFSFQMFIYLEVKIILSDKNFHIISEDINESARSITMKQPVQDCECNLSCYFLFFY